MTAEDKRPDPNTCAVCGYWHPVSRMVKDHVVKEHGGKS